MDSEEFFSYYSVGEMYEDTSPRTKKASAISMFVALSMLVGLIFAVPPLMGGSVAASMAVPVADLWKKLPNSLEDAQIGEKNVLLDKNGKKFAEIWNEDRTKLASTDDISEYAIQALIDTEDKRFWDHNGVDAIGTTRSAVLGTGGGSGITQQLVKNLQFYNMAGRDKRDEAVEKTYYRKIKELKLAMAYEKEHSKEEILLQYFNTVAFGAPNIYSIETAAQYFFGKHAKDLTLSEASLLVGTVQNPVKFNLAKSERKDDWKARQKIVLQRMVAEGNITQKEADEAFAEEHKFKLHKDSSGNCNSSKYPFYCDYVMDYLLHSPRLGETEEERSAILDKGGLTIRTNMDPVVMDTMQKKAMKSFGKNNRVVAPSVITEPGTGAVLGWGFNREYGHKGKGKTTINVADNPAATGSTFKMVTLAAALESGMSDSELTFGSQCPLRVPAGYDAPAGGFKNSNGCTFQAGKLNYRQATAWSSNTWYVTLAMKIGMDEVFDMSKSMGLTVQKNVGKGSLSYVLGATEQSPINMSAAFATFANEGIYCPPTPVSKYEHADGSSPKIPDTYRPEDDSCRRVMSPRTASKVLDAMRANTYGDGVSGAFGTKAKISGYDAVGKSGTNGKYNFAWGQVSSDYSLFIDVYDFDKPSRGLSSYYAYRGQATGHNVAPEEGSHVLRDVARATKAKGKKLNYSSTDNRNIPVPVKKRDFFTVPAFAGMTPSEALAHAEKLGIEAHVSKEKKDPPAGYQKGVIVEQSIKPGTELPVGTEKSIVLYETR